MSKKQDNINSNPLFALSMLIIFCMVSFAVSFLLIAEESEAAAQDIWQHFETLSLIVVGYWFGSHNTN